MFGIYENIAAVETYLRDSVLSTHLSQHFYLSISPPRQLLTNKAASLASLHLVPAGIINVSLTEEGLALLSVQGKEGEAGEGRAAVEGVAAGLIEASLVPTIIIPVPVTFPVAGFGGLETAESVVNEQKEEVKIAENE